MDETKKFKTRLNMSSIIKYEEAKQKIMNMFCRIGCLGIYQQSAPRSDKELKYCQ